MTSTLTLADLRGRVQELLGDTTNEVWTDDEVDAAIRLALGRLSEKRPREVTDAVDVETRELDVSALPVTDAGDILQVWFPYDATDTNALPQWVDFETFTYNDTLYLRLLNGDEPEPGDVARVVFRAPHMLDGLDEAEVTTFYPAVEAALSKGAAAFAFLQRSGNVAEEAAVMSVATPNQAALFATWMQEFQRALEVRAAGIGVHPNWGGV